MKKSITLGDLFIITIIRKIVDEQLNQPVSFGFSYQQFRCGVCGKFFDTEKGCLIHITKKHKKNWRKKNDR